MRSLGYGSRFFQPGRCVRQSQSHAAASPSCSRASARLCAPATTAPRPRNPASTGSSVTSSSTMSGIRPRWASQRSIRSWPISPSGSASPLPRRISPFVGPLLFLYRHVIGREVRDLGDVIRARKPKRLPPVMTREEVKAVHVPSFLCDAPPGVGPRHPDDPGASRPQRRANARRSEGTAHDHTPMSPIAGGTA